MISAPFRALQRFIDPGLLAKLAVVGGTAVAVKLIAFGKELFVAHRFGTSSELDAFLVAFAIPTIIAYVIGDALHDAVIPAYARERLESDQGAAQLFSNIFWICLGVLLFVSVVILPLSGPLIGLLGKNFDLEKQQRSAELLRLLFPFAICFGAGTALKGFLQSHKRFAFPAAAPVIIPLTTILVLLSFSGSTSGNLLALGAGGGSILFLLALAFGCHRVKEVRLFRRPSWSEETYATVRSAMPLMAGSVVMAGCYFIDTMMAASLEEGSVAVLNYGERICSIILSIGGMAVAQVLYPHISDLVAKTEWSQLIRLVVRFSLLILLISIPAILFFWFVSQPVVRLLLERGEFTASDTVRVAAVLSFAAFQIPGYILTEVSTRVVMALRGNRFMFLSSICCLGLNVVLNLTFMRWFGVKGIALSTAVVAAFSATMCFGFFAVRMRSLKSA